MKRFTLLLFGLCLGGNSLADELPIAALDPSMWDAEASVVAGIPPVFVIGAWGGWSALVKLIRFDRSQELTRNLDRYSYSFVRFNLRTLSSVLTTTIQPRIDVYPLSFLGITFGHTYTTRSGLGGHEFRQWTGYDCDVVSCNGWLDGMFIESKFKFAYERFFGVFLLQSRWLKALHQSSGLSFEPESSLLAKNPSDRMIQSWLLAGLRLNLQSSVALRLRRFSWNESRTSNFLTSLVYQRSLTESWNLAVETGYLQRSDRFNQGLMQLKFVYSFADGPEPENY